MSVTIKQVRFLDLETDPNFSVLCEENAEESHIEGMPPISVHHETYRVMDANGSLAIFCAYDEDRLVGFLSIIVTMLPHYSIRSAICESFFVSKAARKTGAGPKLLDTAEDFAHGIGSPCFGLSAPVGSILVRFLPRRGYRNTNMAFLKVLKSTTPD